MAEFIQLPKDISGLAAVETTGEWKSYWEGLQRGELLIQQCPSCGHKQFYPRYLCTACGDEPSWLVFQGQAKLYTYSIIRKHHQSPFKEMAPYVVAMVDLGDGVKMMTNLINCDLENIHIGMALKPAYVKAREGLTVLYWQPAGTINSGEVVE